VPWNAPYYVRCGFRVLDDAEVTPGLRAIRRREAEMGLDRWPRVCMRRDIPAPGLSLGAVRARVTAQLAALARLSRGPGRVLDG
jgi:hypothetical protein